MHPFINLLYFPALVSPAFSTTYASVPVAISDQLSGSAYFGEFTILDLQAGRVDGAFPVSYVTVRRADAEKAGEVYTVILPGAVFDGKFEQGFPDAFQVSPLETVYLQLEHAEGLDGFYNLAGRLDRGLLRRLATPFGDRMATTKGDIVAYVECQSALNFVVAADVCECDPTEGEDAERAPCPDTYVVVDDPEAFGGEWRELVQSLDVCGGVR